jgi:hypothetical protein
VKLEFLRENSGLGVWLPVKKTKTSIISKIRRIIGFIEGFLSLITLSLKEVA